MPGIEPGAFHMQSERSTAELHPQSGRLAQFNVAHGHDEEKSDCRATPRVSHLVGMHCWSFPMIHSHLSPKKQALSASFSEKYLCFSMSRALCAAFGSGKHSLVAWPSGLRRWFKAPVSSEAWVRIPPLPNFFTCPDEHLIIKIWQEFTCISLH